MSRIGASRSTGEGAMVARLPERPRAARPVARRVARLIALALALSIAVLVLAGCGASVTPPPTYPPTGFTPPPVGAAAEATSRQVISALGARGVAARPSNKPYRPPEGPAFASAPRAVLHADVPSDPEHGYVVVYQFPGGSQALAAARDEASYVASGPGAVQFVPDTRFVIRVVDATAIFFAWSPGTSPDPAVRTIADTLATIGSAVPLPR